MFHLTHNTPEPECAALVKAKEAYHRALVAVCVAADYGVFDENLLRNAGQALTALRRAYYANNATPLRKRGGWH